VYRLRPHTADEDRDDRVDVRIGADLGAETGPEPIERDEAEQRAEHEQVKERDDRAARELRRHVVPFADGAATVTWLMPPNNI